MSKRLFCKRFMVILALLVVLAVAAYAWFAFLDYARVETMDSEVTDAGYIRISQDRGETWHSNLTLDLGDANVVGELSGNGLALYRPNYGMNQIEGFSAYTGDELYIEKVFTFESDTAQSLYLTQKSFVAPSDLNGNLSAYGNYSRDYIAGAIRIGFYLLDQNDQPQLLYIWAPNSTYQFTEDGVMTDGSVETAYTYQVGTELSQTTAVATNGLTNGVSEDGSFVWGTTNQTAVKPLITFAPATGQPDRQHLMVRIWLEGSDRECVKQLHNGTFRTYLDFHSTKEGTGNG